MNSLEEEYSFLAPTWKLPTVGTTSMYPGISHSPTIPTPNTSTMHNARYVPPNSNRRPPQSGGRPIYPAPPPPPQSNEQYRNNSHESNGQYDIPIQSRQNGHTDNGVFNHSQPVQKRVQIIDHNRQTPSSEYVSERESQNSYSPDFNQKQQQQQQQQFKPPRRDHVKDNKSDSTHGSAKHANNFNIHEYLYGLSAPDPGSYVSAYKNQQRRLQDEKVNRKGVMAEYKSFVQNGGFGPTFGNADYQTYEQKLDTEKKRKSYSKVVREVNQYKVEEHKRIQNNGGPQRNRNYPVPVPKHRRPDAIRSHFLSADEVRDFERRIKREHNANCRCSLHANPYHASA